MGDPGALDPMSPNFVGWGLAKGGRLSADDVARLAESVGLPGVTFAQIAKGESGYNPRAVGHDPGGTEGLGLWQITTKYNDDIIKRFGGREAMFNPRKNALAAKAIYDRQGIKAWYGTKYLTGRNLHYKGTGGSTTSAKSGGGSKTTAAADAIDPRLNFRTDASGHIFGGKNSPGLTRGRHGATSPTGAGQARAGTPLGNAVDELTMARTDLALSQYGRAKPVTMSSSVPLGQRVALQDREKVAKNQYAAATKEVRRLESKQKKYGLGPKGREKLKAAYDAASQAMSALNTAREAMQSVNEEWDPLTKLAQNFEAKGAAASLTPDIWDDIGVMRSQADLAAKKLDQAQKTGDPSKIAEATNNLKSAKDAVTEATPKLADYLDLQLTYASQTTSIYDDLDVMRAMEGAALTEYTKSLATNDPRQINAALQNVYSIQQQIKDLMPTARDWATYRFQVAQGTATYTDDLAALQEIEAASLAEYQEALASGDPRKMSAALQDLQGVRQQLKDIAPTALDYAELAVTQAKMTDTLVDDTAAWKQIVDLRQKEYEDAMATGDPRLINQALQNLESAKESMDGANTLPSVLRFSDALPDDFLRQIGTSFGGGDVSVTQVYTNPPKDQYSNMRQAQFAAQAAFSG
jgi:hypothetical protein